MTDSTGSAAAGNPGADASGTEAATNTAATPAANAPWYGGVADAELRGFAELKGWKSPDDALTSYRNLEKLQGVPPDRLLKLPEKADDPGWKDIHAKLGFAAPDSAEGYGLKDVEGFDPAFIAGTETAFLKHGVPKDMALAVMKDIAGITGELETAYTTQRQATHDGEMSKLRTEWGGRFDELQQLGQRAAAEYLPKSGLDASDMEVMRDTLGPAKFNKLWAAVGSTMGEAAFHDGGSAATLGPMSPDAALARRAQMVADTDFVKRVQSGDARATAEWKRVTETLAHAAGSTGVIR